MVPKVYIIVLNWNNWRDTLECLESLYRLGYPAFDVIVCDNASTDDSVSMITQWAQGTIEASVRSNDRRILALTDPPVGKPLPFAVVNELETCPPDSPAASSLTILRLNRNRGYASGNNAGLRLAQSRGDGELFWILNNDTVVEPGALAALVERATADPDIGLCGSLLVFYDRPDEVQAAGGAHYRRAIAIPEILGAGKRRDALPPTEAIERRMSYVVGASMLATARFVREVGLMCEDYFLYFEELDWVMRSRGKFKLGFASRSIVYHKEGATAGSDPDWRTRSTISDLCAIRNRLLITRRFFLPFYPLVFATVVGVMFLRLWRRQPRRAGQVFRMLLGPESYRLPLPDAPMVSGQGRS
jgi:GT2 family glycosyltransferase